MAEERAEDEKEAKRNLLRLQQSLPDHLVTPPSAKKRITPVVIALSRDVPAYAKDKIVQEVMRLMPGRFDVLDIEEYFGVDTVAMQQVLVAKKSVLMHVDAGITKVSRFHPDPYPIPYPVLIPTQP